MFADDDPFADFDTDQPAGASSAQSSSGAAATTTNPPAQRGSGNFAQELYTEKISALRRTFFVDLKQSSNGKFIKISEKSRGGQKSTIMIDAEDVPAMIQALQNAQSRL